MTLHIDAEPDNWRALQNQTATILRECGFHVEIEKTISTARGPVQIDVLAEDRAQPTNVVYVCECKLWRRRVPKTVVHSFSSVVANSGANVGLIISSSAFQSGAREAATFTNVRLLSWQE